MAPSHGGRTRFEQNSSLMHSDAGLTRRSNWISNVWSGDSYTAQALWNRGALSIHCRDSSDIELAFGSRVYLVLET